MKARLNRAELLTALAAVKSAVGSSRPFVRLRTQDTGLEVTADDLNVGITARINSWHPMDSETDGEIVLPFRQLQEFVAHCGGTDVEIVVLKKSPDFATIGQGSTRMNLALAVAAEFPQRTEPKKGDVSVTLDGPTWARIQALAPFASTDPAHGARTGVNFMSDLAVASDGFILGMVARDFGFDISVPAGVVAAIGTNAESVELSADERSMRLTADGVTVITSRLGGEFGDHFRLIMDAEVTSTVITSAEALRECVDIARIPARVGLGGGKDMMLRFEDDGAVIVESWPVEGSEDIARAVLDCEVTGEPHNVSFQERWLEAPLKLVGTDDDGLVTLELTKPMSPMFIRRGDVTAMMMPLRARA